MGDLNVQQRWFLDWNKLTQGDWNPFIVMQVTPCIPESAVRAALSLLVRRYSFLHMRVVADDNAQYGFKFVRDDDVHIPLHVRDDGRDWHEVLEDEYLVVFDEAIAPLARCLLVPNGDSCSIILHIHHMLVDGVSTQPIMSDFLSYLDKPDLDVEEVISIDHHALLLKQYEQVKDHSSPHDIRIQPPFAAYPSVAPIDTPLEAKRARSVFRVMDSAALRLRAREEGASITTALTAACLMAARDLCHDKGTPIDGALETDGSMRGSALIVVDMRPFLDPPVPTTGSTVVGDCNSLLFFPYLVRNDNDMPLWELARTLKSDLTEAIEKGSHWHQMDQLFKAHGASLGKGFTPRVSDAGSIVSVSNVGAAPLRCEYGKFKLSDVFVSTAGRMFPPSMVCVAGTWVGTRMSLCFSYMEPLMLRETTEHVADDVVAKLMKAM